MDRVASCCIAWRAPVVAASGVRAATGQGWKCGPASSRLGLRGVPWRLGCMMPRMLGPCVCACALVTRRHLWSLVCGRCLPRHAGHAPGGRRLACGRVVGVRSSRSSLNFSHARSGTPCEGSGTAREISRGDLPCEISCPPVSLWFWRGPGLSSYRTQDRAARATSPPILP